MPEGLDKVDILMDYAGSDGSFIRFAVDRGARGIIVDGVGAGNVNDKTFDAIKYAISKKVAVVIATRVLNGGVYPIYGDKGGGKSLKDIGAIVAGNLDPEKARVLLTLTLPIVKEDHQKLYRFFAIPK